MFGVFNAVAFLTDLVPQFHESAHFAHLGDETDACVHKEGNAGHHRAEILGRDARFQRVQNRLRGRQSEGQFLFWSRTRFL